MNFLTPPTKAESPGPSADIPHTTTTEQMTRLGMLLGDAVYRSETGDKAEAIETCGHWP